MKKIDKYIVKGFLGPYVMSFFVAEFVLVMQFLWKYIDEIIGKGFSIFVLLELIFYFAITIIPMSIPLTILISSVMVFGNLGERYELSSMKSAGVSLTRIMLGGFIIAVFTAILSLVASNYLKPAANSKFYNRLYAIKLQKTTLNFEEGVFNDEIKDFVIRIGDKDQDDVGINEVMVYDHSNLDKSKVNITKAVKGKMGSSPNGDYFLMELEEGHQYRDVTSNKNSKKDKNENKSYKPFIRIEFNKWLKAFDMSDFDFKSNSSILTRKQYEFLNAKQLNFAIDSVSNEIGETLKIGNYDYGNIINIKEKGPEEEKPKENKKENKFQQLDKTIKESKQNSIKKKVKERTMSQIERSQIDSLYTINQLYKKQDANKINKSARTVARNIRDRIKSRDVKIKGMTYVRSKFGLRLHQQFSWALICIVFLFIGAPLGSIVRKGGYGYPLLVAIIFFMLFIILNIMGEKLNTTQAIPPYIAAWLPNLVLIPAAIVLTYMALQDRKLGNFKSFIQSLLKKSPEN